MYGHRNFETMAAIRTQNAGCPRFETIGNISELFGTLERTFHDKLAQVTEEHQKVSEILTSLLQDEDPRDAAEIEEFIRKRTRGSDFCPLVHSKHAMENTKRLQKEIQQIEREVASQKSALRKVHKERVEEETSLRELSGQLAIIKEIVLDEASSSAHGSSYSPQKKEALRKRLAQIQSGSDNTDAYSDPVQRKRRVATTSIRDRREEKYAKEKENESMGAWRSTARQAASIASETSCGVCNQLATNLVERCIVNGQIFHKRCCVCSVCHDRLDRTSFNSGIFAVTGFIPQTICMVFDAVAYA